MLKWGRGPFLREKCLCIDNVGLFVRYDKEEQLTAYNIRRHLIFKRGTYCLVEADNPGKALSVLHREWEGMRIGGKRKISKALRMTKKGRFYNIFGVNCCAKAREATLFAEKK